MTTEPHLSYLVCTTNRTGSNLLCGLLRSTVVAGNPQEYFWRGFEGCWAERWGTIGPAEYVKAAIAEGTTANGVFGAKVMWDHMPDLIAKLEVVHGDSERDERLLLERTFPKLHFIWLWREDVLAQAISLSRAVQTNTWVAGQSGPDRSPRFDFAHIKALVDTLRRENDAWKQWFATNAIDPFSVRYEDLVQEMEGVTRSVLAFLGVELPSGRRIEAKHSKQAGDINAEWAARYRAIVGSG